jgi:hypothetical protein
VNPKWQKTDQYFKWWEHRVLKYGSEDYANFINPYLDKDFDLKVGIIKR